MSDRLWSAYETPGGHSHGPNMLHGVLEESALSEDRKVELQSREAELEEARFALLLSSAAQSRDAASRAPDSSNTP